MLPRTVLRPERPPARESGAALPGTQACLHLRSSPGGPSSHRVQGGRGRLSQPSGPGLARPVFWLSHTSRWPWSGTGLCPAAGVWRAEQQVTRKQGVKRGHPTWPTGVLGHLPWQMEGGSAQQRGSGRLALVPPAEATSPAGAGRRASLDWPLFWVFPVAWARRAWRPPRLGMCRKRLTVLAGLWAQPRRISQTQSLMGQRIHVTSPSGAGFFSLDRAGKVLLLDPGQVLCTPPCQACLSVVGREHWFWGVLL